MISGVRVAVVEQQRPEQRPLGENSAVVVIASAADISLSGSEGRGDPGSEKKLTDGPKSVSRR